MAAMEANAQRILKTWGHCWRQLGVYTKPEYILWTGKQSFVSKGCLFGVHNHRGALSQYFKSFLSMVSRITQPYPKLGKIFSTT